MSVTAVSYAAADAAIEAQEGSVDHWIEYYKKERGAIEVPAAVETKRSESEQKRVYERESDTSPVLRPPASIDQ